MYVHDDTHNHTSHRPPPLMHLCGAPFIVHLSSTFSTSTCDTPRFADTYLRTQHSLHCAQRTATARTLCTNSPAVTSRAGESSLAPSQHAVVVLRADTRHSVRECVINNVDVTDTRLSKSTHHTRAHAHLFGNRLRYALRTRNERTHSPTHSTHSLPDGTTHAARTPPSRRCQARSTAAATGPSYHGTVKKKPWESEIRTRAWL
jgi:hypothetical protein